MGCASAPAPTEQLASAEASMRAAREVGAQQVPKAELHLRLAQEQVETAKKLAADGDNERAGMVLNRAHADAELALALTRESTAQHDLEQTKSPAVSNQNQETSAVR
jgi:hypothetical protein